MGNETVHATRAIDAPADAVWAVVRAFDGAWHPDIVTSAVATGADGALTRRFEGSDGGFYAERLTYFSDSDRTFRYALTEGIEGCRDYRACVEVRPADAGGSIVDWCAEIRADSERLPDIASGTRVIFERGLDRLAADLPAVASPARPRRKKRAKTVRRKIDGAPWLSVLTTETATDSGPLVLFLHGIGGNATNWDAQIDALGTGARVAALDMRGYGESEPGLNQSRIEEYCEDILRVADSFDATRLILVGLSMGSWIATSFAMRHPDRLAGLVLAGGCTGMSEAEPEERDAFRAARLAPLENGETPADFASAVVDLIAGPNADAAMREALRLSTASIPAESYLDALTCFCNPVERFDFSRIGCPVLMMTGDFDRLAPPEEIRGVAGRIHDAILEDGRLPDVRFEVIAGAGHLCNLEAPEAFNGQLAAFLDRLLGAGQGAAGRLQQRQAEKRKRILDAALAEFCRNGFNGASMDAIAAAASVSKPTLYQYIGDKDALLTAVLQTGRDLLITPLETPDGSLVERLWNFSWTYADFVLRPDMLSLARLILGDAARRPDAAIAYHNAGPGKAFKGIVGFVGECVKAGQLRVDDVELAAQDLWSLILSGPRDHHLHFVEDTPDRGELLRSIGHGLRVFLKVYSTDPQVDLAALDERISRHSAEIGARKLEQA